MGKRVERLVKLSNIGSTSHSATIGCWETKTIASYFFETNEKVLKLQSHRKPI
jgi:hypothetical protein